MTQSFDPDPIHHPASLLPPGAVPWNEVDHSFELPELPPRRFYPLAFTLALLAWLVIAGIVALAVISPYLKEETASDLAANDAINLLLVKTQARQLLGFRALFPEVMGGDAAIFAQVKPLNAGSIDQRLRFVILAGELQGPSEALSELDKLDDLILRKASPSLEKRETQRDLLRKLYSDYHVQHFDVPSLSNEDRRQLHDDLGWFGDLALAPTFENTAAERAAVMRPAKRVVFAVLATVGIGACCLFLGFCGLLLMIVFLFLGYLRGGLKCGTSPAGVYAETFALWMLSFVVIGLALRDLEFGSFRPLAGGVATLLTLVVLVWPVLRGVPWRQVREDLGLTLGRRPAAEPAIGAGCYILGFPIMFIGFLVVAVLTVVQKALMAGPGPEDLVSPHTSSHPIMVPLAGGDWGLRLQMFFLASFVAPVVEETLFRGVLYRHLRELTHRFATFLSILSSALVSSFIFAVIHPQGLVAVPLLMALACGFALAREWRGTLIPCMVAHGLHNGLALVMSIAMMGD